MTLFYFYYVEIKLGLFLKYLMLKDTETRFWKTSLDILLEEQIWRKQKTHLKKYWRIYFSN